MVQPNAYTGRQLHLRSGRVLIIAKDNDIFLNSKESISLSTNKTINLDCGKHIIFNAPKIYQGLNAVDESQPATRGSDLRDTLSRLINSLDQLVSVCEKSTGDIPATLYLGLGILKGSIAGIKETYGSDLNKIVSKKIFVE